MDNDKRFRILTLNNIATVGLDRLPREKYEIASEIGHPDGIILRSFKMHDMDIPDTVKAVARAGAGVNNIPVERLSERGVPVFNAPGANANAVKELVLAGMLLASRNIVQAWDYARQLDGDDKTINEAVEKGKKQYVGFELPGKTLGVVGLGAIGVQVANSALDLGMNVLGFDPQITVERAWQLSSNVDQALSLDELCAHSNLITVHVPLVDATRGIINADRIGLMPKGSVILNFSRDGIVDETAVVKALDDGHLHAYVTDFPSRELLKHPKVIALPHLGASTLEAEENCAVMVANQLRDFLENGNIRNSVNFPDVKMPRTEGAYRLAVANANVPNMVGQITTQLAEAGLNIIDLINKSRGKVAYTVVDVEAPIPAATLDTIRTIEGVLNVRSL
ncbi:MAG: phosphoglycerate dehydrogenase [Gammaproteobacteria bacterium]|nr:phosphoglycerate dehydrogenase [Gammaproteobacteria bacterium]